MEEQTIYIDTLSVARKFGFLIADKGSFSGLEFAKKIIASNKDCEGYRTTCASSVASSVYKIQIANGRCMIQELL